MAGSDRNPRRSEVVTLAEYKNILDFWSRRMSLAGFGWSYPNGTAVSEQAWIKLGKNQAFLHRLSLCDRAVLGFAINPGRRQLC